MGQKCGFFHGVDNVYSLVDESIMEKVQVSSSQSNDLKRAEESNYSKAILRCCLELNMDGIGEEWLIICHAI
jgi:hypothetical protein